MNHCKVACGTTSCFADVQHLESNPFIPGSKKDLLDPMVFDSAPYDVHCAKTLEEFMQQDSDGRFFVDIPANGENLADQRYYLEKMYASKGVGDGQLFACHAYVTNVVLPKHFRRRIGLSAFVQLDGEQIYSFGDMLMPRSDMVSTCKDLLDGLQMCTNAAVKRDRSYLLEDGNATTTPDWIASMRQCLVFLRSSKEEPNGDNVTMKIACVMVFERLPVQLNPITLIDIFGMSADRYYSRVTLSVPIILHDLLSSPEHEDVFWGSSMQDVRRCVMELPSARCSSDVKEMLAEIIRLRMEDGATLEDIQKYFHRCLMGCLVRDSEQRMLAVAMGHEWHDSPFASLPREIVASICVFARVDETFAEQDIRDNFRVYMGDKDLPW